MSNELAIGYIFSPVGSSKSPVTVERIDRFKNGNIKAVWVRYADTSYVDGQLVCTRRESAGYRGDSEFRPSRSGDLVKVDEKTGKLSQEWYSLRLYLGSQQLAQNWD